MKNLGNVEKKQAVILPFAPRDLDEEFHAESLTVWAVIVVALAVVGVLWKIAGALA